MQQHQDEDLLNSKHLFRIECESRDVYELLGRPCELSAFSFVPKTRVKEPIERSIYNVKSSWTKHEDEAARQDAGGFNNKSHRCDRKHAKLNGLDVWSEEIHKNKPTKSSHEYGKRLVKPLDGKNPGYAYLSNYLDTPDRKYARIAKVQSEFYNRNGINDLNGSNGNI